MSRNNFNLLIALAVLIIVTVSCVSTSSRKQDSPVNQNSSGSIAGNQRIFENNYQPQNEKKSDDGDFIVEHFEVKNPRFFEIDRQVKDDKTLEKAADKLNQSLILPHDIYLRTKDCGEVNAFYDPADRSVTVCYELMEHFYKNFRSVGNNDQNAYNKMFDAVRFAFLHEIGHALIDVYNLSITGSEEDAADRCSSFINLTELGEDGVNAVLAAADSFAIDSKKSAAPNQRSFAGEHLLQEQRFYNSLCMIYGSNTEKYAYILEDGYLPRERAVRCPNEYERTVQSWSNLLARWRNE
jgi:hypothetical protein